MRCFDDASRNLTRESHLLRRTETHLPLSSHGPLLYFPRKFVFLYVVGGSSERKNFSCAVLSTGFFSGMICTSLMLPLAGAV
jgi:hypothetical protein